MNGGGGGGGGGGGQLGSIAAAVGLGALSSVSPRLGYGVRTGMGIYNQFQENSQKRRINEVLAKHYGASEPVAEEVSGTTTDDDILFGSGEQSLGLGVTEDKSQGAFGLGGGGKPLGETTGAAPMGLFSGSQKPPMNIKKYLEIGATAQSPEERDSLISDLVSAGADPTTTLSLVRQKQAREDKLGYQNARLARTDQRRQDTLTEQDIDNERAERRVEMENERLGLARERDARARANAEITSDKAKRDEDYRAAAEARRERAEARAIQAFEMTTERHEANMEKIRTGKMDPSEIGQNLKDVTSIITDMSENLLMWRATLSPEEVAMAEEKISELEKIRADLLPAYTSAMEKQTRLFGGAPGPEMVSSHEMPTSTPPTSSNRFRFGVDFK